MKALISWLLTVLYGVSRTLKSANLEAIVFDSIIKLKIFKYDNSEIVDSRGSGLRGSLSEELLGRIVIRD